MSIPPSLLPKTMKAAVLTNAGPASNIHIRQISLPTPKEDDVLIRIRAFGVNRSELFTRQGLSPNVKFPRVLGIEAVGEIAVADELKTFHIGEKVATVMGGLGRDFDGSYAEYTCVKAANVRSLGDIDLSWELLGACPEMLQTAWGSLFKALRIKRGERLLVRGGTTSVGLAAAAMAKKEGLWVASTSRKGDEETRMLVRGAGADEFIVDDGMLSGKMGEGERFDKVLELVGTGTLRDSLGCLAPQGVCCMMGMVGNKWSLDDFSPMEAIPSTASLTVYSGGPEEFREMPLHDLLKQIEEETFPLQIGKVFKLDDIVEAHETMERNLARGKIVVLT